MIHIRYTEEASMFVNVDPVLEF